MILSHFGDDFEFLSHFGDDFVSFLIYISLFISLLIQIEFFFFYFIDRFSFEDMRLYEWILLRWIDSLDLPVSDLIAYLITIDTNLNHILKVPQYPRNCYYGLIDLEKKGLIVRKKNNENLKIAARSCEYELSLKGKDFAQIFGKKIPFCDQIPAREPMDKRWRNFEKSNYELTSLPGLPR